MYQNQRFFRALSASTPFFSCMHHPFPVPILASQLLDCAEEVEEGKREGSKIAVVRFPVHSDVVALCWYLCELTASAAVSLQGTRKEKRQLKKKTQKGAEYSWHWGWGHCLGTPVPAWRSKASVIIRSLAETPGPFWVLFMGFGSGRPDRWFAGRGCCG